MMFLFQANPPNPEKIPVADLVGVTVVLLTCSYRSAGESPYAQSFFPTFSIIQNLSGSDIM